MESEDLFSSCIEKCISYLLENDYANRSPVYQTELSLSIEKIRNDNSKLLEMVELLESPLTNTVVAKRCAGVCFLTDVLEALNGEAAREKELVYFVDFYCDRLKDHHLVLPYAVKGLCVLSSNPLLPAGRAKQIVTRVFKEVHNQSMMQQSRNAIYSMCNNFLQKRFSEIKELGQEFVFGYIQAMDGEKDPHNLLLVFNTVPFIAKNLRLDPFVEELFEVVSCYFPIDFTPPPNSVHGVTRESLILGLRQCLAASPLFAPFCIPLLLEKLDSDVIEAKIDALQTLIVCAEVYGADRLSEFSYSLLNSIRREMFISMNESVQENALRAVVVLVKIFSSSVIKVNSHSSLEEFLDEILKECKKFLCEPELKLIRPSARILLAAASASTSASCLVLKEVMPLLLNQVNCHSSTSSKVTIIEILNDFLEVAINMTNEEVEDNFNCSDIIAAYFVLLHDNNENLCLVTLRGFHTLLVKDKLLSISQCENLCEHLLNLLFNQSDNLLLQIIYTSIKRLVEIHPEIILKQMFPVISAIITNEQKSLDSGDISDIKKNSNKFENSLFAVSAMSTNEQLTSKVILLLFSHITKLSENAHKLNLKNIISCINCLQKITQENLSIKQNDYLMGNIFYPLLNVMFNGAVSSLPILQDRQVILASTKIFEEIVSRQNEVESENLVKDLQQLFLHGKTDYVSSTENNFYPLQSNSPIIHQQLIFILEAVVCFINKTACSYFSDEFLNSLQKMALQRNDSAIAEAAIHVIATVINKSEESKLLQLISYFKKELLNIMTSSDDYSRKQAFLFWIWITKALVIRSHYEMEYFLNQILSYLNDDNFKEMASRAFHIISENYVGMSENSNANISPLYHQKFFVKTMPHLIQGFKEIKNKDQQLYYLLAVNHLLHFLPFHVLAAELESLLPLLIQALAFENNSLLKTALITLNTVLLENPTLVSSYLNALYTHFVHIAQFGSTMEIRMKGLECLNSMTKQETSLLLPMQKDVIRGLAQCLDDKKRLVRQKAALTRGNWFLVGAPGSS